MSDQRSSVLSTLLVCTLLVAAVAVGAQREPARRRTTEPGGPKALAEKTLPAKRHGARPGDVVRALEPGRGRGADSPWQIPWAGWQDILIRTYHEFNEDRVMTIAAGVVFYVLLAIFPGIAAFVSLYALFANVETLRDLLAFAADVVPTQAFDLVQGEVLRIAAKSTGALGFTSIVALAIALWSANSGTKAVFDALNIVFEEDEKRSFLRLNLISLGFTAGFISFLIVAAGLVIVVPLFLAQVGLLTVGTVLLSVLRWPLLFIVVVGALSVLYRYGPSRRDAKWRWVTVGSALGALIWLAASGLFSWYLSSFADYTATYGSLGAVMGLIMWLWVTFCVIFLAAELNAEIEHQTARDSTVGPGKPRGSRGATMADEVGAAQA